MSDPEPLSAQQIEAALGSLTGWVWESDALVRHYAFADFRSAIGAIVRIGFEAESLHHHPELHNVYNRVDVRLTTHDAGNRVTDRDVQLARRIEAIARG